MFLLILFIYVTFVVTNVYFNALAGADNYKYFQNILFIYGEASTTFDNQGLLYYFLVSFLLNLRTSSFNYNKDINTIFKSDAILLSETILITNLLIFIYGLFGFYFFMKKLNISRNKCLSILILITCFPSIYYLRLNMKPEILAFALLPWIFYLFEKFKESKKNIDLINIAVILSILITSKGSIAAMVLACLFLKYILNYKSFSSKHILIGLGSLVITISLQLIENNNLGIGNLLDRNPESNYDYKASSNVIYNIDFERLFKDPKKNYHKDSLIAITLIDLTGDYFELNWKEDSVLFSKNIKPLFVSRDRELNNENLKLFNLDLELKNIVYSGPGPNYTKYYLRYVNVLASIIFLFLIVRTFFKGDKNNKAYLLFPFIGIFVLLANTILGFPQNNFDPTVGDTYKVFYYSFLIPFSIIIVLNNVNLKKIRNIVLIFLFILFTFINFGFPKSNNEDLDLEIKENVENMVFCEINKDAFESSFITEVKIECLNQTIEGPIKTDIKKIPFISIILLFFSSIMLFISTKKNEI
ncbi:hypothetical protein OA408_03215 [Acidimicrobiaceae bacterium]|nr:hypothetical protein [Acidimicrobiaceae bacterium]